MDGNTVYKEKYVRKINSILSINQDKDYLKGFYYYISSSRLSYSTAYDYLNYVLNFINYVNKDIERITLDDYTEYLSMIKDKSSSYQISVYSGLKKFSLYLLASKRVSDNPMAYINRPKFREELCTIEKRDKGFLDKREIKRYIEVVEEGVGTSRSIARQKEWKARDLSIILIFLSTGIRCSALYKLNMNSIDFKKQTLITTDKGDHVRECNLSTELLEIIQEWIEKRKEILGSNEEEALFISNQKTRLDQSSISRIVNKYAKDIKGKHITPHKLRATYGTQLYNQTKDLFFVQECMGHSNPKTTEKYIRGEKNNCREGAANIMKQIIF
jgi:site-specific recombinase XerD